MVFVGIARYQQYIKYHWQYDYNTVVVLSQYHSDDFLYVWNHHSSNSGNFKKTFDAY